MRGKMKAQVFYEPEDMRLEEIDIPAVSEDEVLIKVKTCSICGSDIAYYWGSSLLETPTGKGPLVLGHEIAGEIVEMGTIPRQLGFFEIGDRVTIEPVQYCNTCEICKRGMVNLCENKTVLGVSENGGFAEYVKSKYTGLHKLPPEVSFEEGALVEPLADAIYAVNNLNVELGNLCVVFGPGPIGNMMVQLLKSKGARKVVLVGTRDYRLELGRASGADIIINLRDKDSEYYASDLTHEIKKVSEGRMAERVVCATAAPAAMQEVLKISGGRSIIVYFGLPGPDDILNVPVLDSLVMDKTIRFSWLSPLTWPHAIKALAEGLIDVKPLITHQVSLKDTLKGLQTVKNRKGNAMKAIIVVS